jgi:hypothetical protein
MTWEFFRRAFSRSSIASRRPSGERITPGSQRCTSVDEQIARGSLQWRPPSVERVA